MTTISKSILLLTSLVVAMSAASCVNAELTEPEAGKAVKELATIDEQVASMEATVADLEALQAAAEGREEEIAGAVSALSDHIADLKAGTPLLEGTLATLAQQKKLAGLIGTIEVGTEPTKAAAVTKAVASIDKGAGGWLGKHFASYYPAFKAEAAAKARLASYDFRAEKILVEGILSDVEAGLRKEFDAKELAALAAGIGANAEQAEELAASFSAVTAEVEEGYTKAVETAVDDPENFDLPALTELNSSVAEALADADNTLAGLIARVEECETQIAELKDRVAALEGEIADLNELFGMIQSVAFMSEYSTENAIAYYTLGTEPRADGKMNRTPQGTIDLNYIVRPASAAAALTVQDLWNDEVKVFGYYAQTITKATPEMVDFAISNVAADESGSGIVTVTVSASALSEEFYFKEKGAKLALSVTTGKTDLTTKFVEIVPKDASGKVYIESLALSPESIEIDDNETAKITAKVLPDNASVQTLIFTSSNNDIATVSADGTVTAKAMGDAVITVTTSGTDEWGRTLKATCAVKINSSIKIAGAGFVEEGGQTELHVDSPNYIDPKYVTWEIGTFSYKNDNGEPVGFNTNQSFASIDENGKVSGLKEYHINSSGGENQEVRREYVPLVVRCKIAGAIPITMYHEMRVVAVQPLGISISGLADTDTQVTTKVNQAVGLYGTIMPETVNGDLFKIVYLGANDGYFAASNVGSTTVTLMVQPGNDGFNYFYPKGKGLSRNITVNVEPYYVQTLSLPATFEMNLDQTATLTPTFTSDVGGKDPSYQDLKWTSSNPDIVSINETTGEMTSHQEGTVMITATTSHADAVPSGQSQKSATCAVTVKKPTAPISIGDYYYSDGTWSTELDASKTVIGIVFAKVNAAISDVQMINDYPECTNGLVVSTAEYKTALANSSFSRSSFVDWMNSNGYNQIENKDKYCGYSNTKGMLDVNNPQNANILLGTVATTHGNSVAAPENSTGWYIPSMAEMRLLYDNFDAVNSSIGNVNGTVMTKTYITNYTRPSDQKYFEYTRDWHYWCAYVNWSYYEAFNINTGADNVSPSLWGDGTTGTIASGYGATLPVRVILAF